ncbi:MAG: outer membrane lipoprotein carrier protein LolA [Desulfobacterota bacterium]|nr:outer membrane lipoprotein carrier protein LolA [Thermodesulfobacteriota bacterium]MDW8001128.1 outer membrane lipoprotein carrier protein LolA [Deltaproteobacteria bacterium]
MKKHILGICVLIFVCFSSIFATEDVREKYSNVTTFQAKFKQTIHISSSDSLREFSGEFFYKKKRGFLWVYKSPRLRYFLFDGQYLYQYDEERPFIIKEKVDPSKTKKYFLDLIEDLTNLETHFRLKERISDKNYEILNLEPKTDEMITALRIWFGKDLTVKKIEIVEKTGNRNTLIFNSVVLNGEISDERFVFKKDRRKEVIER